MNHSNLKQQNQEIVLAEHPSGLPTENTFKINDIDMPQLKASEVLIKSIYVSVDPGMRGFMNKGDDDAAGNKFQLNKPITSRTVAQIIESNDDDFAVGDIVHGRFAWQKYQTVKIADIEKVDPTLAPISTAVSMLGIPGLSAYFGMLTIGQPKKEETVVVSGAAGSVGSIAAQIAKIKGCKVIGIAGSAQKIAFLEDDLGLDKGINYHQTDDMEVAIKEACPDGVDVFFDNVGGELFDAVFANINKHGRVAICGQIAEYNADNPPQGPRPMQTLIKKSARMEGFVVYDFADEFDAAKKQIAEWYNAGQLKYKENLIEGFENIPSAFIGLFTGENIGKQMIKTGDLEK
ncbi:NADP-dependent oxidoreductase [Psychrobacter sp. AOP22-C1-22]|uniref:NADP-dependent oxidoreductase n=1 Tax=unclassified Psychrobacter TaxID=196806 RepID=UPI0017889414|nr:MULTISPECIES: NADP-dependent oxidoreductase [unclassified Psychrobacter]MBE0406165.1 NADP-dependent oxidoreductase [Psychrobacter sp. FME6]MBE0443835.1 NADP-dependent oxidoreductase [Psychrobacter sp. FME5]